ncbi:hypothetical protein COO60DRAFT_1704822 [Scenedesmus sp. NREL 46B-D3]|nr:hypothetical protein COO60DRAFT_1704822 [Scenedesmus sp. NREL 46B-D3]
MGKHNGKARSQGGTKVGAALTRRHKSGFGGGTFQDRHTTDMGGGMQSILERNDLDELMAMAELADRDFTAERYQPVVISTSAHSTLAAEQSAALRAAAEARNVHKLCIPRRPKWDASTTPEQLDAQEKAAFLNWRRQLAVLEEEEELLLTPFERNLEVWRQLWRVLERSDIVVQVVDARDPLTYLSRDLVALANELHPTKSSFVLLNKADLLPEAVRAAWADFFDARGLRYGFCYFRQLLGLPAEGAEASGSGGGSSRTRILSVDEMLVVLEGLARQAVDAADEDDPRRQDPDRRLMVGLVGYPNVGKSSTINAIFGAKKTAVAPTPGKTKHFQTLNVSPTLCLCDCPGLVFPRFAASKAEMVAAGVIPIDRLTDVRAPIEVAAARCGKQQLEAVYGIQMPPWPEDAQSAAAPAGASTAAMPSAAAAEEEEEEPASQPAVAAAAAEEPAPAAASYSSSSSRVQQQQLSAGALLLLGLARARGWATASGLADEARAGRQILKDYTNGKILYCKLPPGIGREGFAPDVAPLPGTVNSMQLGQQQQQQQQHHHHQQRQGGAAAGASGSKAAAPAAAVDASHSKAVAAAADAGDAGSGSDAGSAAGDDAAAAGAGVESGDPTMLLLSEADLELMEGLGVSDKAKNSKRAEHKFHKKAARSKGSRGLAVDAGGYDGAALSTGKKGGLVRVGGY